MPFIYSGCEGNDNRFLHLEECEEVCLGEAEGTKRSTVLSYVCVWLLPSAPPSKRLSPSFCVARSSPVHFSFSA
uniref:BPTI/Kunitz inhibitor domain-containing protein n=1 Tax=Stegastes partitus TaxID=144197 RepID=A0A3B5B8G1_9TELE